MLVQVSRKSAVKVQDFSRCPAKAKYSLAEELPTRLSPLRHVPLIRISLFHIGVGAATMILPQVAPRAVLILC